MKSKDRMPKDLIDKIKNRDRVFNLEIERLSAELKMRHKINLTDDIDKLYSLDKLNIILFDHGFKDACGLKDYVLIDYIEKNKFMIKARPCSRLLGPENFFNILLNPNFSTLNEDKEYGDFVIDFLNIHKIALLNPGLSRTLLETYLTRKDDRKFFRLFSIYSAIYSLDLLTRQAEEDSYNVELANFIIDAYDDFTLDQPKWYK